MRKLKLDIEEIQVESFQTSADGAGKGTVRGAGDFAGFEGEIGEDEVAPPPGTVPPDKTCDTCIRTCETRCTCPTNPGCHTCV